MLREEVDTDDVREVKFPEVPDAFRSGDVGLLDPTSVVDDNAGFDEVATECGANDFEPKSGDEETAVADGCLCSFGIDLPLRAVWLLAV